MALEEDDSEYDKISVTLVDCPGHSSLIRTIMGGACIIDMIVLVVDVTKGIQPQTAECLILATITTEKLLIVLNKIDLIPEDLKASEIDKRTKEVHAKLAGTRFTNAQFVCVSALTSEGVEQIGRSIHDMFIHDRPVRSKEGPLLIAVDHCFPIKGKGTVLTGTVLHGQVKVGETIEFPALNVSKKVKSIQSFHKTVQEASQGDRVGLCVAGLNPELIERGVAASPQSLQLNWAAIAIVKKVDEFQLSCESNSKCHVTVGHATTMALVHFFGGKRISVAEATSEFSIMSLSAGKSVFPTVEFNFEEEYEYQKKLVDGYQWALLRFEQHVLCPPSSLVIGSRLDADVSSPTCRIAFCGRIVHTFPVTSSAQFTPNQQFQELEKIKILKPKKKTGTVEKLLDQNVAIVKGLFKKESDMSAFLNMYVCTAHATGRLESGFGKSGKARVQFTNAPAVNEQVWLEYSKLLFNRTKKLYQRREPKTTKPQNPKTPKPQNPDSSFIL